MRPRLRTAFLGLVSATLALAIALLRRVRRDAAGGGPQAAAPRGVAAFAGTPCSREGVAAAGDAHPGEGR